MWKAWLGYLNGCLFLRTDACDMYLKGVKPIRLTEAAIWTAANGA